MMPFLSIEKIFSLRKIKMSSLQSFLARASVKTVEQFEKFKQDAEKTLGIEATVDDPVLKQVQNFIVEEEDVLELIQKISNQFIDSVSLYSKRDVVELFSCMRSLLDRRGTSEQKNRMQSQLDVYVSISEETSTGEDSVANWLILELQTNVLNRIEKQMQKNELLRAKFWKLKQIRRHASGLGKIANVDKKSKAEHIVAQKDCADLEQELVDQLIAMKETGAAAIDVIWNEYCRIEAEYYSKMNEAYLEPSSPKPQPAHLSNAKTLPPLIPSPEIGTVSDEESENATGDN
jgi:hypothetical protein